MSIILFGDFAIPFWGCINVDSIKPITDDNIVIANLEGPFISMNDVEAFDNYKINLCAESECVNYLKDLNINYLSFANNHILDFKQSLQETISVLKNEGIDFFGTADKPYVEFFNADKKICIWGAVSFITGRISNKYDKINDFNPIKLLNRIGTYKKKYPDAYLIIYLHWGYEFARFPQPADREWALRAIDFGANAVIGVHPHVVQGIEKYKNGIIVYSLGNYILPKAELTGGPSSSNSRANSDLLHLPKIGIEINLVTDEIIIHNLIYDKKNSKLAYSGEKHDYKGNTTPFVHFSNEHYRKWYKKQNYTKEQESRFNIYPTFYSYFRFYNLKFHLTKFYLVVFRLLRRLLIIIRLHTPTPYNVLTKHVEEND